MGLQTLQTPAFVVLYAAICLIAPEYYFPFKVWLVHSLLSLVIQDKSTERTKKFSVTGGSTKDSNQNTSFGL